MLFLELLSQQKSGGNVSNGDVLDPCCALKFYPSIEECVRVREPVGRIKVPMRRISTTKECEFDEEFR